MEKSAALSLELILKCCICADSVNNYKGRKRAREYSEIVIIVQNSPNVHPPYICISTKRDYNIGVKLCSMGCLYR